MVDVGSADVNAYLKDVTGEDFTSKDFRTWAGTVLAAKLLRDYESVDSEARAKKNIVEAIEQVAKRLGNTARRLPEVLRASRGDRRVSRWIDDEDGGAARQADGARGRADDGVGGGGARAPAAAPGEDYRPDSVIPPLVPSI